MHVDVYIRPIKAYKYRAPRHKHTHPMKHVDSGEERDGADRMSANFYVVFLIRTFHK